MDCYHCGLPVPEGAHFPVEIDDHTREMCCVGCQAVAQAIVSGGHSSYYRNRDSLPESPREALPASLRDLGMFDHPEVQKSFVRPTGEHEAEASLILEGITCAACVWLNEAHIARQPGVLAIDINYTTRRARVRWDTRVTRLSAILEAIAAIGYHAHPYDADKSEQLARKERKSALWRLFVSGFGMMQVMMYAIPVYLADDGTMSPDIEQLMRWASLLLTLPVVLYSAAPFFKSALRDVRLLRVGMDVPVALGVGAAFAASLWATVSGHGEVYFDSVTMFVFFLLGGRYLEMMARQKAVRGVEALAKAMPTIANRLVAFPSLDVEQVVVGDLQTGDLLLVKPGEVVPADGVVIQGDSATDESMLTGESLPIPKRVGDDLTGGCVNTASPLVMRVVHVGEQTRVAAIQRLMEQAAAEKPRLVQAADKIAGRFILALVVLAVVTAIAWYSVDPTRALWVFVSVLVVSCPCALSLATPAALTVATGGLASRGLLVARGHAVETLASVDVVVFDKTGTLTYGAPRLKEVFPQSQYTEGQVLQMAAAMEQASEHPLAKAIRDSAADKLARQDIDVSVTAHQSITGAGVAAELDGVTYRLGSVLFAAELHSDQVPDAIGALQAAGETIIALANPSGWVAFFRLEDELRESSAGAVAELAPLGIETCIMSGDAVTAAQRIANKVGISKALGSLSPEGKHAALLQLQTSGKVVAMVGDGVNDAPVLAQAQVSIAMGGGTDLARTQADMVLLGEDMSALSDGVRLARRTMRVIRQNLVWAFAYNFLAIPFAMMGWITPWMAGIGMSASSLFVVLNALRLQRA